MWGIGGRGRSTPRRRKVLERHRTERFAFSCRLGSRASRFVSFRVKVGSWVRSLTPELVRRTCRDLLYVFHSLFFVPTPSFSIFFFFFSSLPLFSLLCGWSLVGMN